MTRSRLLQTGILLWAALALIAHLAYWLGAVFRLDSSWFQVVYGMGASGHLIGLSDFILTSLTTAALLTVLWLLRGAVRALDTAREQPDAVISAITRLALGLAVYAGLNVIADIILATVANWRGGAFGLALVLDMKSLTFLGISLVLFLVCRELRRGQDALSENQQFL